MGRATGTKTKRRQESSPAPGTTPYSLRLYVVGSSLKSAQAVQIANRVCGLFPPGRCKLEVVDLYQQPDLAMHDNVLALPSLIKMHPPPRRTFVGITEDTDTILRKLGLPIIDGS